MYIMKFSNRDHSYNSPHYHGKFVHVDYDSGGYPCAVDTFGNGVYIFTTLKEALGYKEIFTYLDIFEVLIEYRSVE